MRLAPALAVVPAVSALLLLVAPGASPAAEPPPPAEIPCGRVEGGVVQVDGLLDDWADVTPLLVAGKGPEGDFALALRCNFDDKSLYLAADVRDDKLVRDRRARKAPRGAGRKLGTFPAEDGLELVFEDKGRLARLRLLPGDPDHDVPALVSWDPTREGQATKVEALDSLQREGWAFEIRLPLDEVPGWLAGARQIRMAVVAHDADPGRRPRELSTSPIAPGRLGRVTFGDAGPQLDAFLRDRKLTEKDIRWSEVGQGTGRVVLARNILAYVSDDWSYVELPVDSPADILEVRLVDLSGEGQDTTMVRYREHGDGGSSREILAIYRVTGSSLGRSFGVEVAKAQGASRLSTKVSLVKRGPATDLVVEAQPAVGWNAATYREATAVDVTPIPLPWSKETKLHFQFRGEEYFRIE